MRSQARDPQAGDPKQLAMTMARTDLDIGVFVDFARYVTGVA